MHATRFSRALHFRSRTNGTTDGVHVIPIHDDNPTQRVPTITIALIVVNIAVFALELTRSAAALDALIDAYAFVPARFFEAPMDPLQWMTLVTAAFLHGGWLHLGGNMLYLWIFGNNIEDRLGAAGFLGFYLGCGAIASIAQGWLAPASTIPLIGASGAIAGVLGAYMVLYPRARVVTVIPVFFYIELAAIPAVFVIGFWFVMQLISGFGSIAEAAAGGVAWWAHVGGFVAGALAAAPVALADAYRRARSRRRR